MKHAVKAILPLLFLVVLISASCKKDGAFMNEGVITGYDARSCPCCGGLMINFKGALQSYSGEFYLVENNPADFAIDNSTTFPIRVK